jgi:chromosome partitioning protein
METTAVGWPGPAPVETEPLGWIGVSRETPAPLPRPSPESPTSSAVPPEVAAPTDSPSDQSTDSPSEESTDSPTGESTDSPAAGASHSEVSDLVEDLVDADADPVPTPRPAASDLASAGVLTAADLAAQPAAAGDESNPPLAQSVADAQRRAARQPLPHPDVTRIFVVANQKGGVGKTTTAVNIAAVLAQHGQRVLLIDLDPQGNASTAVGVDHTEGTPSAYQVLIAGMPIADVVAACPEIDGLDVVPATIDLAGAEIELVSLVARETRLRKALDTYLAAEESAGRRYDYVFIDCPPSLGLLTVNALSAGREMLIPIQCEYYALEGVTQLLRTLDQVREHLNPALDLGRIVLTMFDGRTRLAAGVADEVREHFGDRVLKVAIPRSVRISEAPSYGQTVLTYDPGSTGALSYLDAALELAEPAVSA